MHLFFNYLSVLRIPAGFGFQLTPLEQLLIRLFEEERVRPGLRTSASRSTYLECNDLAEFSLHFLFALHRN